MNAKHTPGPWQYAFEGGTVAFIVESDLTTVAKLSVTENTTAHAALPANSRLIAAAPELLEALQWMVDAFEPHASGSHENRADALRTARKAITKATEGAA